MKNILVFVRLSLLHFHQWCIYTASFLKWKMNFFLPITSFSIISLFFCSLNYDGILINSRLLPLFQNFLFDHHYIIIMFFHSFNSKISHFYFEHKKLIQTHLSIFFILCKSFILDELHFSYKWVILLIYNFFKKSLK